MPIMLTSWPYYSIMLCKFSYRSTFYIRKSIYLYCTIHCKNVWVVSTHLWLSELQSSIDVSNSGKQKQVEITQMFLQCISSKPEAIKLYSLLVHNNYVQVHMRNTGSKPEAHY